MCGRSSTYFDAVRPAGPVSPAPRSTSALEDGKVAVVPPAHEAPRRIRNATARRPFGRYLPTGYWCLDCVLFVGNLLLAYRGPRHAPSGHIGERGVREDVPLRRLWAG